MNLRVILSGRRFPMMTVRLSEVWCMAEVKFAKGSEEWQMFMDYWALCQQYWEPEDSDEWWEEVIREIDVFIKKYGATAFVRGLCMALVKELEMKHLSKKEGDIT